MPWGQPSYQQEFAIVNFYWLFWLGLSLVLAIILGFVFIHPVIYNR